MESDFLVSVIIPVYNAEQFLEKAVLSANDLNEVGEVILVEDGSSDGSFAVCQKLSDKYNKVKLLQHPNGVNKGAGASRNLGIKMAKYPYIGFLDADDYFLSNRYELTKKKFLENETVDAVYEPVGTAFINDKAKVDYCNFKQIPIEKADNDISYPVVPYSGFKFFQSLVKGNNGFPCTDGITLRKTVFDKSGYFNERLKLHQDAEFWIKSSFDNFFSPADAGQKVIIANRYVHESNRITKRNYQSMYLYLSSLYQWSKKSISGTEEHQIIKRKYFDLKVKAKFGGENIFTKILWRVLYWIN